jgi:pyrroline-5-carboxylate reductase
MGAAILRGAIERGVVSPSHVTLADPDPEKLAPFIALGASGLDVGQAPRLPSTGPRVILWAVKPQLFPDAAKDFAPGRDDLHISIMAGVPTSAITSRFKAPCVRVMPNTPAQIGQSATALCAGTTATSAHLRLARALFEPISLRVVEVPEQLMDAVTALSGSGPAYVFYLAQALIEAAQRAGLDQPTANDLVRATLAGASEMLLRSSESPETLRAAVTSKGGTTAAAFTVMEDAHVRETIARAVLAGRDRGAELAKLAGA